ncbi:MAG TPA: carboxyl transferase domain-containing protein [Acidimicrobiales bacterium]|jgi:acetyl-CoA carboxylase carboxyltransferase component
MTVLSTAGVATLGVALRARTPGAVQAVVERIDERPVVVVRMDASERRGALSSTASGTLAEAARTAKEQRIPLVAYIASSGADIVEGMAALHGWGQAARAIAECSGIVPIIMVVDGPAVSGPALLLGLADFVVMTQESYAFVSGPAMVAEFTGVLIDNDELGGATVHARQSGAATLVVPDADGAELAVAELLAYLPSHTDSEPPRWPNSDPPDRLTPEAGATLPRTTTGSYDMRDVMAAIVDDGGVFELRARWAPNLVTAFATIDGRPVGILANQPLAIAGTLDIPASQKGARFVAFCDAFNLPIITLVDTPGFYPGKDLEWRGMIRHGAQLVFAYGRATVARICVILRKSYGGAYIVMDSKRMGNDVCLAWPGAELAVMGAGQAAAILQRRASPEERATFEKDYETRLLNPYIAAERGYVDAVIEPAETRREISRALHLLSSKREDLRPRKHDNSPL